MSAADGGGAVGAAAAAPVEETECCHIPPIQLAATENSVKGKFETIPGAGGMKCYVTGPATATKGIIFIYDIFGYFRQTLRGADILAYNDSPEEYKVFIPDLFAGKPLDPLLYDKPADDRSTKEKAEITSFWNGPASQDAAHPKIPLLIEAIQRQYPFITSFAGLGACWGAAVIANNSFASSPFLCAAQVHPAFLDKWEAKDITIPTIILASSAEINGHAVVLQEKHESLRNVEGFVHKYPEMHHGWMTAKADLKDEGKKNGYLDGYGRVLGFFNHHM